MSKRNAEILRNLARYYENGSAAGYTCLEIAHIVHEVNSVSYPGYKNIQLVRRYMLNFARSFDEFTNKVELVPEYERRNLRILLLCFAAAIEESE